MIFSGQLNFPIRCGVYLFQSLGKTCSKAATRSSLWRRLLLILVWNTRKTGTVDRRGPFDFEHD